MIHHYTPTETKQSAAKPIPKKVNTIKSAGILINTFWRCSCGLSIYTIYRNVCAKEERKTFLLVYNHCEYSCVVMMVKVIELKFYLLQYILQFLRPGTRCLFHNFKFVSPKKFTTDEINAKKTPSLRTFRKHILKPVENVGETLGDIQYIKLKVYFAEKWNVLLNIAKFSGLKKCNIWY